MVKKKAWNEVCLCIPVQSSPFFKNWFHSNTGWKLNEYWLKCAELQPGLHGCRKVGVNHVWMTAAVPVFSLFQQLLLFFSVVASWCPLPAFSRSLRKKDNNSSNALINRLLFNNNQWLRLEEVGRWGTVCFTFLQLTPQTEQSASLPMQHFNSSILPISLLAILLLLTLLLLMLLFLTPPCLIPALNPPFLISIPNLTPLNVCRHSYTLFVPGHFVWIVSRLYPDKIYIHIW